MSECKLKNGSISTLVQEDLRQDGSESWVKNWPDECSLEVGTIIRIPYDEEVIDRLEQEKEQSEKKPEPKPEEDVPPPPKPEKKPELKKSTPKKKAKPKDKPQVKKKPKKAEPKKKQEAQPSNPSEGQNQAPDKKGEEQMPSNGQNAITQVPGSPNLTQDLTNLAGQTGTDPMLTIVLALVAVLGGGTAWKFYRQYSEQKHDERMQQMKLDSKSKSDDAPGECKTVHAQLNAEITQIKTRLNEVDNKLAINADFDGDRLARRVKKLERWRKDVEEEME